MRRPIARTLTIGVAFGISLIVTGCVSGEPDLPAQPPATIAAQPEAEPSPALTHSPAPTAPGTDQADPDADADQGELAPEPDPTPFDPTVDYAAATGAELREIVLANDATIEEANLQFAVDAERIGTPEAAAALARAQAITAAVPAQLPENNDVALLREILAEQEAVLAQMAEVLQAAFG